MTSASSHATVIRHAAGSLVLLLTCFLLFVSCSDDAPNPADRPNTDETGFRTDGSLTFVESDGSAVRSIDIEIAETEEARARGLMFRQDLGYDRGMLFLFETADTNGFWMKNTPLPLDILFVSPDSQIINIVKRTTPFSEETVTPEAPKQFVVEVRGGFTSMYGIEPGMRIRWSRNDSPGAE